MQNHNPTIDTIIWKNAKLWRLWSWCNLMSDHDGHTDVVGWQEVDLERGQFIFTIPKAKEYTGLSVQEVRTGMDKLKSLKKLTVKTTNKYSVVTIENNRDFDGPGTKKNSQNNSQITGNPQSNVIQFAGGR